MRPMINPSLRRLRRDDTTIQLGTESGRALVVGGMGTDAVNALDLIDGTRTYEQILDDACLDGLPRHHGERLLGILAAAGTLVAASGLSPSRDDPFDAQRLGRERRALSARVTDAGGPAARLARRRAQRVTLAGADLVTGQVALILASAGVGSLRIDDPVPVGPDDVSPGGFGADDIGAARETALRARLHAALPWVGVNHGDAPADLVLTGEPAGEAPLRTAGRPHLAVGVRDGTGVVGPLVVPGRTACLRCLELTRADRDPAWPRVAAQLAAARPPTHTCEVALAVRLAGLAAAQALAFLDADPAVATCDGTLEIDPREARVRRRSWQPHPACGCGAG
jgi:bacteriocin biosynthesis cyclodehydratase domain-containing protein